MFYLVISVVFFSSFSWSATPAYSQSSECTEAYKIFQNQLTSLEDKYRSFSNISISDENKPRWNWGKKKKAVYLLHGFIGTPEEMADAAKRLHQKGYTVINDLIPGYAASGIIANQFDSGTWISHVETNLNAIRTCFREIHLIGFSTGGLLLHNYIRQHQSDFTAKSLILYSPFYKPHFAFADFLRSGTRLLTPVVLTKPLYYLTRFPDIKVAVLKPENYLQQLPLDGAKFVIELGKKVDSEVAAAPLKNNSTATLLFVSNADQIMNLKTTLKIVAQDFTNLHIVHFKNQYVPHHLMVSEVSDVAEEVLQQTEDFILLLNQH